MSVIESKKYHDLARIRTWTLLIRSQTRYPLRHKARSREQNLGVECFFSSGLPHTNIKNYNIKVACLRSGHLV